MVDSLLVAFSALLFIVGSAHAQVIAPNCSDSSVAWSLNSLGQGPCLVTAYLASVCNNGAFTISALLPQHSYTGPNGPDNDDLCKCNTVTYNLISACGACQGQSWISYSQWTANCTAVAAPGTFPGSIPKGTRVPRWAYLDPTSGDSWNLSLAQSAGDSPEVTGSASIVPTSSMPSSSSNSSSTGGSKVAEVAGGVVGGIIGTALIAGIVIWSIIRRRRARSALTTAYIDDQDDMKQAAVPSPLTTETPRLYDPSDPSTYPTRASILLARMQAANHSRQSELQYSGLPEV